MNRWIVFIFCLTSLGCINKLDAQNRYPDEWWPVGSLEFPDSFGYGNAWLHFQNGTVSIQPANLNMNFEAAIAVASDTLGNVLFYSNGCEIRGSNGVLLENGNELNPGALHDWVCGQVGYTAPRSMTALPLPGNTSKWVILHLGGNYDPSRKMVYGPLYLTEVDMSANGGLGAVTEKNIVITEGDLEPFSIVRHGNGRDWWVVLPEFGTNRYQIRLLSPEGLSSPDIQAIGPEMDCRRTGSSTFSLNGAKYARTNSCIAVVMDFDRCAGVFSNPVTLQRDAGLLGGGGLAFSPDNRWLYATSDLCIFRADLEQPAPFLDSLYKKPYYFVDEPPISEYVYGTSLTYMQSAPDGKLYLVARHRERYYPRFTIDGEAFAFEPEGSKLPVPTVRSLPHFPNFRLFDLKESLCDTLGINGSVAVVSPQISRFAVSFMPNPFNEQLVVQSTEPGLLEVYSLDGKKILSTSLMPGINILETSTMKDGIYIGHVILESGSIQVNRLIKSE